MRYLPPSSEKRAALEFIPSPPSSPQRFTFQTLNRWIERYAFLLHRSGIRKGERVCLFLPNSPQLVVALFGNHLLGVISVPVNPGSSTEEFQYVVHRAEISGLISDQDFGSNLKLKLLPKDFWQALEEKEGEFPENENPDVSAVLCFTSGTTSQPKGVILTHRNLRSNIQDLIQVWGWKRSDRFLLSLPLFHIHGLGVGLHGWALTGCTTLVTEKFDPGLVRDLLINKSCSLFMGVPTMYRRLVDVVDRSQHRFPALRLAITGSAPMPVELHRLCRNIFGHTLLERYGMSETMMNISNPLEGERKPGSVGLPLPSVQIRLMDENLREIVEPDQPGEIFIRGPNVFSGYWRDPEASKQAFLEGWFRSGDVAYRDSDGYYYVLGRLSFDIIKSGGYRIGAREIEEVLERHPAVREVAAVGLPDEDLGERVTAFVVPAFPVEIPELLDHCSQYLARYKCPRSLVLVDSLPKNSLGKITKNRLKSMT